MLRPSQRKGGRTTRRRAVCGLSLLNTAAVLWSAFVTTTSNAVVTTPDGMTGPDKELPSHRSSGGISYDDDFGEVVESSDQGSQGKGSSVVSSSESSSASDGGTPGVTATSLRDLLSGIPAGLYEEVGGHFPDDEVLTSEEESKVRGIVQLSKRHTRNRVAVSLVTPLGVVLLGAPPFIPPERLKPTSALLAMALGLALLVPVIVRKKQLKKALKKEMAALKRLREGKREEEKKKKEEDTTDVEEGEEKQGASSTDTRSWDVE